MKAPSVIGVECRWCGPVTLPTGGLRCAVDPSDAGNGLCEFACPICDRAIFIAGTAAGIGVLVSEGAREIMGRVPFEILEPHKGPALSWDEFLDLHLALDRTLMPQEELAR